MNAVARNFMSDADPAIALAVQTELQTADWRQAEGWNDLAGIADKVTPTSLVVYTEAMSVEGSRVTVPADLTVHLIYQGSDDGKAEEFDQNFPALLRFSIATGTAKLEAIEVDLTSEML